MRICRRIWYLNVQKTGIIDLLGVISHFIVIVFLFGRDIFYSQLLLAMNFPISHLQLLDLKSIIICSKLRWVIGNIWLIFKFTFDAIYKIIILINLARTKIVDFLKNSIYIFPFFKLQS